jgi:hypothetical protein
VDDEVRSIAVRAHRSVTRAIKDKDPDAAVRRMSRHVHAYAEAALEVEKRTAITLPEQVRSTAAGPRTGCAHAPDGQGTRSAALWRCCLGHAIASHSRFPQILEMVSPLDR